MSSMEKDGRGKTLLFLFLITIKKAHLEDNKIKIRIFKCIHCLFCQSKLPKQNKKTSLKPNLNKSFGKTWISLSYVKNKKDQTIN